MLVSPPHFSHHLFASNFYGVEDRPRTHVPPPYASPRYKPKSTSKPVAASPQSRSLGASPRTLEPMAGLVTMPGRSLSPQPLSPFRQPTLKQLAAGWQPGPPELNVGFWADHTSAVNARTLKRMNNLKASARNHALPPLHSSVLGKLNWSSPEEAARMMMMSSGNSGSPYSNNNTPSPPKKKRATFEGSPPSPRSALAPHGGGRGASRKSPTKMRGGGGGGGAHAKELSVPELMERETQKHASMVIGKAWRGHSARSDLLGRVVKAMGGNEAEAAKLTRKVKNHFTAFREVFSTLSWDKSSRLRPVELEKGVASLGIDLSNKRVKDLIEACEKDRAGEIAYDDFVQALANDPYAVAALGKKKLEATR